jgi:hypothetical protein
MSYFYNGEDGTIRYPNDTISGIVNYPYNPTINFPDISGLVFPPLTISNFIDISGPLLEFISILPYKGNITANRFLDTFIWGFLSISGNIVIEDSSLIFDDKILSISDAIQIRANNQLKIGFYNNNQIVNINEDGLVVNNGYISLSGFILHASTINYLSGLSSNLENQLTSISSKIFNIELEPGPKGDPGEDSTISGPIGPRGRDSTISGPIGPPGRDSTISGPMGPRGRDNETDLLNTNNTWQQQQNFNNSIILNNTKMYFKENNNSHYISYCTDGSFDGPELIGYQTVAIGNRNNKKNLKVDENGIIFNKEIYMRNNKIYLRGDENHYLAYSDDPNIDGPELIGKDQVSIGTLNSRKSLEINSTGIKTGSLTLGGINKLTSTLLGYLSNIKYDVQHVINSLSGRIFEKSEKGEPGCDGSDGSDGSDGNPGQDNQTDLLTSENNWSDKQNFKADITMNDKTIHFGETTDFRSFLRQAIYNSDIIEFVGYEKVIIGSRDNKDALSIDTNGIKTDSITIGENKINNEKWGYLSSVTQPIHYIGATLQKKFLSQSYGDDLLYSYDISENNTPIFEFFFTPKSNNSSIRIYFDVSWRISGGAGRDIYRTELRIDRVYDDNSTRPIELTGLKRFSLNGSNADQNNRNSTNMLFPISGVYKNRDFDKKRFQIGLFLQANDNINLEDVWNMTFEEIQE